jgi:hypothetical protein
VAKPFLGCVARARSNRGTIMKKPKDLLFNQDLIGFTLRDGGQVVRRASSAKVTEPSDPAKGNAPAKAPEKS